MIRLLGFEVLATAMRASATVNAMVFVGRHLVSLCAGIGLLASGCADEQESLIVLHAPAWESSDDCFINASNDTAMSRGVLDVAYGTPYTMPLILLNQLVPQSAANQNSGTITNEVQLREADVLLSSPNAPEVIDALAARNEAYVDFTWPLATDSVPPGQRTGVFVDAISAPASLALAEEVAAFVPEGSNAAPGGAQITILAEVVIRGERSGNTSGGIGVITSRSYSFPITICIDCLFTCETCENATCPAEITSLQGGACNNAQDLPLVPSTCDLPD